MPLRRKPAEQDSRAGAARAGEVPGKRGMEQIRDPGRGNAHHARAERGQNRRLRRARPGDRPRGNHRPADSRWRSPARRISQSANPGTDAEMNYEQAIEFLFSRVNYERLAAHQYSADDFKLDRMREFLRRLGDPQETIPAVHIA